MTVAATLPRPADRFGPWTPGIDPAERLARLRSMAALAKALAGPAAAPLIEELHRAEQGEDGADEAALAALDRLPPRIRRNLLSSFQAANPVQPRPPADRAVVTRPDPAGPVLLTTYGPAGPVTVRLTTRAAAWLVASLSRVVAASLP